LDVDWVARGIAMAGVVIALASLGWNMFAWRGQGPAIKAMAKCSGRGPDCIEGSVTNIGRFDAELDRATSSGGSPTVAEERRSLAVCRLNTSR